MKPRHRSDSNAPGIVRVLKNAGCHVVSLESPRVGQPDLIVGFIGRISLLELKTAKGRLSNEQKVAHSEWARVGVRVHVVRTGQEALEAAGVTGRAAEERLEAMRVMREAFEAPDRKRAEKRARLSRLRPARHAWDDAWNEKVPVPERV
jgi:hypothetical protein